MAPFLFPYPTTGSVTFSNVLLDRQLAYTTELADATVARTALQVALSAAAAGTPGSSPVAVLEAVQVYYPYLRSIIACLDTDDLLAKENTLVFPWRSPLTHYSSSPPLLNFPTIHAEHLYVLVAYTAALANYAHSILGSLPQFEASPALGRVPNMTADDQKKTTAGLARAVDLLCQASGIAEWAAANVVPTLDSAQRQTGGRLGKSRWPVETGPEGFRSLSLILLADANVTGIRKLLLPVLSHQLFAPPGPPLPANHPSVTLLAKLYLHVSSQYTSAGALFKAHESATTTTRPKLFGNRDKRDRSPPETDAADSDLIPELKRYLRKESLLSCALAYKWLGVDAGENSKTIGTAIAWLRDAHNRLAELEDGRVAEKMKGLSIGRGSDRRKEVRRERKGRLDRELADVAAWTGVYTRMNDTVSFERIPPTTALVAPPGRPIFNAKAFTPPAAKFAPVSRVDSGSEEAPEVAKRDEASYAGKGNYF